MGYQLYVAGARGSRVVCGKDYLHFGGDTSCYVITNGEYALVVDAGSGLSNAAPLLRTCKKVDVALTHVHYDHIIGLLDFDAFPSGVKPCLHGTFAQWGMDETEHRFVQKPYWPVPMRRDKFRQITWGVRYAFGIHAPLVTDLVQLFSPKTSQELKETIEEQRKEAMEHPEWLYLTFRESEHPDFCSSIQVEVGGKTILFLCDYEHGKPLPEEMLRPYDIVFYDGMYRAAEYPLRRGYGHSTPEEGVRLARKIGIKQLVLTHHNPKHTDEDLYAIEQEMQSELENVKLAYTGMTIEL